MIVHRKLGKINYNSEESPVQKPQRLERAEVVNRCIRAQLGPEVPGQPRWLLSGVEVGGVGGADRDEPNSDLDAPVEFLNVRRRADYQQTL